MPLQLLKAGLWDLETSRKLELHAADELQHPATGIIQDVRYAILSHRWGRMKDEVLHADLVRYCDPIILREGGYISVDLDHPSAEPLKRKVGWYKICEALEQAQADGYDWLWVDTCCIDKSSSAELSEAINSMFEWYRNSAICYAFLDDVASDQEASIRRREFYASQWFQRGWTLQELLAPAQVVFFSADWKALGNKRSLAEPISKITKISVEILCGAATIQSASIAKRMSWAAGRRTKRIEDRAYSLLGIFDISMPMLYGEGRRAFQRLQEEIMRTSDDQSIFCWIDHTIGNARHGLLADDPDAFAHAFRYRRYESFGEQPPFETSNRGLRIKLHLTPTEEQMSQAERPKYAAALLCPHPDTLDGYLSISVEQLPTSDGQQYGRVDCDKLAIASSLGRLTQMFVRSSFHQLDGWGTVMPLHLFHLSDYPTHGHSRYRIVSCEVASDPLGQEDLEAHMLEFPKTRFNFFPTFKIVKEERRVSVALKVEHSSSGRSFVILLGSRADFDVGYDLQDCENLLDVKAYEPAFRPRPFGSTMDLPYRRVDIRCAFPNMLNKNTADLSQCRYQNSGWG